MEFFGFELFKKSDKKNSEEQRVFTIDRDTSADTTIITSNKDDVALGGVQTSGFSLSTDLIPTNEEDLIKKYRQMALSSEIDIALQEIKNEMFVFDDPGKKAFELFFKDDSNLSKKIQNKIIDELDEVYEVMEFDSKGPQYVDSWYVDGRIYWHKIVDFNNPAAGIKRVQTLDPLDTRRIRVVPPRAKDGTINASAIKDFYFYSTNIRKQQAKFNNFSGYNNFQQDFNVEGIRINPDNITYINSGLYDRSNDTVLSYLYKAIEPFNKLRMAEDSMLIFRIVRAPQRRVIYVDVGGMNTVKAESYMQKLMANFKNKMVYDTKTGTLNTRSNLHSMLEDYWLPRKEGGRSTEIQSLDGQSTQDILEEVQYYKEKLWDSLNVPKSRFGDQTSPFNFVSKDSSINRDEYRFTKFMSNLRNQFIKGVEDVLRTQLILKKVITPQDWVEISKQFYWKFTEDNMFVEARENEELLNRLNMVSTMDPLIGKYYSTEYIRTHILRQTPEEQKLIDEQNAQARKNDELNSDKMGNENEND